MVHFFKLLLVTGVTCIGLVPLMPSRLSGAENVLPSHHAPSSATASSLRLAKAGPLRSGPTSTAGDLQLASVHTLASIENLLFLRSGNIDKADFEQIGKWLILVLIPLGAVGTALYCLRPSPTKPPSPQPSPSRPKPDFEQVAAQSPSQHASPPDESIGASQEPLRNHPQRQLAQPPSQTTEATVSVHSNSDVIASQSPDSSTLAKTTRIAKVDIVEALIVDLHHPSMVQRRKSIWELGQRGDSRAIQPLVDLLVDADSQQRSLILAAIAEISTRALKPMHRALLMSLQDESADVRKNAIRDITRIYDQMAQVSQLLQYAASDTDADVQETARWALGQLNRLRTLPEPEALKPSKSDE